MDIKKYILNDRSQPLVIYGSSGCGKTSVLAMTAMKIHEWTEGKASVIIRFLGTTLASSDASSLMNSIIQQAQYTYSYSQPLTSDKKKLEIQFHEALQRSSSECPLVLILDSLDQLNDMGGGRQLKWLLRDKFYPHTKIVLSALPEEEYICFPKLKAWLNDGSQLIQVTSLSITDVRSILDYWLHNNGRTLTMSQRKILLNAYENCPLPLYLKLSIGNACEWHSYSDPSTTVLQSSVESSINTLFQCTENKHGKLLVSRALGYLTLVQNGLSESELEDILSCDDEVLNAVYIYWTPPIRRLPPLLWVRIKNDLEEYLVNRGSNGIQVLYWYHRQFIEVANDRYCFDPKVKEKLFQGLIDFFSGTWADGRAKPYVGRNGQSGRSDRLVTSQPVQFNNRPNLRKLNILPYLLTQGKSLQQLKDDVLLNFNFLFTKLKATCVMEVVNDFSLALEKFPGEEDLAIANKAILLSQNALDYDPNQLVTQLLGRLSKTPVAQNLLSQCKESGVAYLEADQNAFALPGGQLIHCIPAHKKKIISFDMSSDKKMVVTLCSEGIVKFWDIAKGIQSSRFESDTDKPEKVQFCCQNKFVVVNPERSIIFISVQTTSFSHNIENKSLGKDGIFVPEPFFEVCGPDKTLIVFHCILSLFVWDIPSRKLKHKIYLENEEIAEEINSTTQAAGSEEYFALLVMGIILVVHLETGATKSINVESIVEECDIDGIGLCPLNSILYFGCPEDGTLYTSNLKDWKEDNVKQLKGNKAYAFEKFHISSDGQAIYFSRKTTLRYWDLTTDELSVLIPQNGSDLIDFGIVSKTVAVSVSDDRNLRIWDLTLTQSDDNMQDNNYDYVCSGSVRKIQSLKNGRYVTFEIGFGPLYWYIYDVWNSKVIIELKLERATCATLINDYSLAVVNSQNYLKIVDLQSCQILVELTEPVSPGVNFVPIKEGKVAYSVLRDLDSANNYNSNNDSAKGHNVGLVFIDQDDINNVVYIIDLMNYTILQILKSFDVEGSRAFLKNVTWYRQVTDDGSAMIILVERFLNGGQMQYFSHAVVWDIEHGNVQCMLVDHEYLEANSHVKSASFLSDDQSVLSNHKDNVIRIFSVKSGCLFKRLEQHHSNISTIVIPNAHHCYLLSYSNEEVVFCLWRSDTFENLATIKLDEKLAYSEE
eukprot:XP_014771685.1 PREDICTED: uncharacterized protein LOC106870193 [Octopus bimaculoides]